MSTGFRRGSAERRFRASYAKVLARWPLPAQELDLVTSFGTTRVRRCGEEGPPLVLLPGANVTSLSWFASVAELGAKHRLYLVDTLGEIGMSTADRSLPDAASNVRWLCELLDALDLPDAHFAGASRGGWLALLLASEAPQRVRTATVIDPPGLQRFGMRWYLWLTFFGLRTMTTRSLGGAELGPFYADLFRALPYYRLRVRTPEVLAHNQLRQITLTVHILLGERSALGRVQRRAARAALLPNASVEIIDGATHDFALRLPDLVTRRILQTAH